MRAVCSLVSRIDSIVTLNEEVRREVNFTKIEYDTHVKCRYSILGAR
jgi:hypothetical protein